MAEHCNYPSCRNKKLGGHVKGSSDFKIGGIKRVSVLGTRDSVADKLDVYFFFFLPHISYSLGGRGSILQALKSL